MAKITIKRKIDPIMLSDEKAKKLKEKWGSKPKDARVDLGDWAGTYGDIANIEISQSGTPSKRKYSDAELEKFEQSELKPYLSGDGALSFKAELDYLRDKGYIKYKKINDEVKTIADVGMAVVRKNVQQYTRAMEKISQWVSMQGRKQYGTNKREKALDKMAESLGYNRSN